MKPRAARCTHRGDARSMLSPQQGKVVGVGAGKIEKDGKRTPLDVKQGDTILFGKYSGQEVRVDSEDYLIMREDEVLAVIEGGKKK